MMLPVVLLLKGHETASFQLELPFLWFLKTPQLGLSKAIEAPTAAPVEQTATTSLVLFVPTTSGNVGPEETEKDTAGPWSPVSPLGPVGPVGPDDPDPPPAGPVGPVGPRFGFFFSALAGLGKAMERQGDLGRAIELFEESLAVGRATGDTEWIAQALFLLGNAFWRQDNVSGALMMVQQALALYDATGDLRRVATCIEAVAVLAGDRGDAVRAARLFGAAAGLFERVGVPIPRHDRFDCDGPTARSWDPAETVVAAAWAEGRGLSLEQAVAEALDWADVTVRHTESA